MCDNRVADMKVLEMLSVDEYYQTITPIDDTDYTIEEVDGAVFLWDGFRMAGMFRNAELAKKYAMEMHS